MHDKLAFHRKNSGPKVLGETQIRGATPSHLLIRLGPFRLPPVFVDGPRVL